LHQGALEAGVHAQHAARALQHRLDDAGRQARRGAARLLHRLIPLHLLLDVL
jgi:hypothetical protein